jgi:hypothetical protein
MIKSQWPPTTWQTSYSRGSTFDIPQRRIPNLFVVGAMKSGTSALCRDLGEHPDVFMSRVKEPEHFSQAENWSRDTDRYLQLFEGASREAYLVEGSTEYTKRPEFDSVAERIHQFNPDARIIYIMRDPFSRVVSHYRHQVRKGREKRPLPEAVRQSSQYLTTSYYAYQLRPYLDLFGHHAVYVDTFESFTASPPDFYDRLFTWLDLDASFVPPSAGKPLNVSPPAVETYKEETVRVRLARQLILRLKRHPRLARLVPETAIRLYRKLLPKESVRKADSTEFSLEVEETRHLVQPLLADWVAELQELTGRSYYEWASGATDMDYEDVFEHSAIWLPEGVLHEYLESRSLVA